MKYVNILDKINFLGRLIYLLHNKDLKMARICAICGKGSMPGIKYKRRGMIKRKGGAGSKIIGKTLRRFFPNLQKIKILIKNSPKRALVCTCCIQAGKIVKA